MSDNFANLLLEETGMATKFFLRRFVYFGHNDIKRDILLIQTMDKIEINSLWWNISINKNKDFF